MLSRWMLVFCFKQETAYELRISDWSSDVRSSDLGVIGLTRHGALKWARDNIRVNAVCPGVIETPMTDAVARNPDLRRAMEALTPMGRKNGSASSRERGCQYVSITVVAVALINNE